MTVLTAQLQGRASNAQQRDGRPKGAELDVGHLVVEVVDLARRRAEDLRQQDAEDERHEPEEGREGAAKPHSHEVGQEKGCGLRQVGRQERDGAGRVGDDLRDRGDERRRDRDDQETWRVSGAQTGSACRG